MDWGWKKGGESKMEDSKTRQHFGCVCEIEEVGNTLAPEFVVLNLQLC